MVGYDFARDAGFDASRAHLVQPVSFGGQESLVLPVEPEDRKHSVYLSGRVGLTDSLELFADASYVHKAQTDFLAAAYPSFSFTQDTDVQQTNEEYGAVGGARIKFGSSWKLEITGDSNVYANKFLENNQFGSSGVISNSYIAKIRGLKSFRVPRSQTAISCQSLILKQRPRSALTCVARRFSTLTEPNVNYGQANVPGVSRTVRAIFGELHIPLIEQGSLPGSAALRCHSPRAMITTVILEMRSTPRRASFGSPPRGFR